MTTAAESSLASVTPISSTSSSSTGPLPKSDSVQSLVSLVSCPPSPPTSSCSDTHVTIRGVDVDGNAHSISITDDIHAITLSAKRLHTLSLGALASPIACKLRQVSLAANALTDIDLTPLSWCSSLLVLTLNSNRLTKLDLSPLSACKLLERLWLHDNCLESIDLSSLSTCHNLRSLYLEDNSIHLQTIDLTPLEKTKHLRSLRLGGNRLNGHLNVTPLLQCSSLSVFNVDTAVSLSADAESSQARSSPALRRVVLDIKFNPPLTDKNRPRRNKGVTTPPKSPPSFRRKPSSTKTTTTSITTTNTSQSLVNNTNVTTNSTSLTTTCTTITTTTKTVVVRVLLIGFRRLARYAAEDSLARCGKVVIRASTHSVATSDPSLILDSHLILLYSPPEKTIRQVMVVAGRIPLAIVGTERYRTTADSKLYDLLNRFKFYKDPIGDNDAKVMYQIGTGFANGDTNISSNTSSTTTPTTTTSKSLSMRKSQSESILSSSLSSSSSSISKSKTNNTNIELEDIEDDVDDNNNNNNKIMRTQSTNDLSTDTFGSKYEQQQKQQQQEDNNKKDSTNGWFDIRQRMNDLRSFSSYSRRAGRSQYSNYELSIHGRTKLRAERTAIETAFTELGGYASGETCSNIARVCGLAKCAGPLLFRSAYGSTFEVEATTPEAGIPNAPMERKKRISCDAFMAYWDSRLKSYDGEERLSNVLEDSHFTRLGAATDPDNIGHSPFGAYNPRQSTDGIHLEMDITKNNNNALTKRSTWNGFSNNNKSNNQIISGPGDSMVNLPTDLWCPCDAGIEELIRNFMEGRASRFGSYALVKLSEAVAIGCALVIYALRGSCGGRVGGRARAVCPKEVKQGKLNAGLIAAEVGIFEGVTAGLSMNQIRSIKGCFATEVSPTTITKMTSIGYHDALSWTLSRDEVIHFCVSRKTLLPCAVQHVMRSHCRKEEEGMSLAEFSVLLCVLSDVSSDGALDYFFTVVDIDQNDIWTMADLRHFHMEKERLWFDDGMAVNELHDLWVNLLDMIGGISSSSNEHTNNNGENIVNGRRRNNDGDIGNRRHRRGITRRDLFKLGAKDRKGIIQTLLYVDDDYSSVNIRRTMELNNNNGSNSSNKNMSSSSSSNPFVVI